MATSAHERQSPEPASGVLHAYEMLELREFEHRTEEAAAIQSVFGEPVADRTGFEPSTLPLVITGYDQDKIARHLKAQRAQAESALRPIAVAGIDSATIDPVIEQLADIVLPPRPLLEDLRATGTLLTTLAAEIERLRPMPQDPALTLIQFLHTRNGDIDPMVDADSSLAYRYPLAETFLGTATLATLEILADLARHDLLDVHHVDRVFTCPDCGSYRVPVKELCPDCQSTNLCVQESIHHFRCSYVAPEAEFFRSGRAICPKCNRDLRHIGVEYNRPGRFIVCQDCGYWASEPELTAWCADCDRNHEPGELVPIHIHRFSINRNSARVARTGSWDPAALSAVPPARHPDGTQAQRVSTAPYTSDLAQLAASLAAHADKPMKVYKVSLVINIDALEPHNAKKLVADAQQTLREVLHESDIVAHNQGNEFLLLVQENKPQRTLSRTLEKHVYRRLGVRLRVIQIETENQSSRTSGPLPAGSDIGR